MNGVAPGMTVGAGTEARAAEVLLLQICDSVFPIGAYSHSYGLETYIQLGLVHDEATAWQFVERQIRFPLTYTELLGMRLAFDAAQAGDLGRIALEEACMAASKVPDETRTASQKMAARFCKTAAGFLEGEAAKRFSAYVAGKEVASDDYADAVASSMRGGIVSPSGGAIGVAVPERKGLAFFEGGAAGAPCARPVRRPVHMVNAAYGVFAALAGVDEVELLRRYLYSQVSAMVTNCVKTVPLSQTAGQRLLFRSAALQVEVVETALHASKDLLGLSMPGFDVRCIEHETLYSRLYMS
ncbi:urease accessory protein UreF [Olsenella uli]|uniref:urease accessory protein UreF n=1 Tax=Olsenella uli TaxID=133926 RepID=UPI002905B71B|nr:urease accessory UreF family protein [Olsenella uli]